MLIQCFILTVAVCSDCLQKGDRNLIKHVDYLTVIRLYALVHRRLEHSQKKKKYICRKKDFFLVYI